MQSKARGVTESIRLLFPKTIQFQKSIPRDLALPGVFAAAARAIADAMALGATCAGASAKASAPSEALTDAEGAKRIT